MSSDIVIQVDNLSKQYRLGVVGTGTIAHDLNRWWCRTRGRSDPYAKVTEANDRTRQGQSDYVWALKDITFEVKRGEALGIIGTNGAGKSTLLKVLSRVTAPTTGEARTAGRVASLLEVGTGFHPDLTGRENIYLNGAIMGMSKEEVRSRIDEIVDFSGCSRYIDTPVKRYSSGMRVRLGFAVAAHLEPDILIVDEVLAVGDMDFQRKCIGKMQDVAAEDRTVLFVSHNMASMKSLCRRGITLDNGGITDEGDIDQVVRHYISRNTSTTRRFEFADSQHRTRSPLQIVSLELRLPEGRSVFLYGEPVSVDLLIQCTEPVAGVRIGIGLVREGVRVSTVHSEPLDFAASQGHMRLRCSLPAGVLLPGLFALVLGAYLARNGTALDHVIAEIPLEISDIPAAGSPPHDPNSVGMIQMSAAWQFVSADRSAG